MLKRQRSEGVNATEVLEATISEQIHRAILNGQVWTSEHSEQSPTFHARFVIIIFFLRVCPFSEHACSALTWRRTDESACWDSRAPIVTRRCRNKIIEMPGKHEHNMRSTEIYSLIVIITGAQRKQTRDARRDLYAVN